MNYNKSAAQLLDPCRHWAMQSVIRLQVRNRKWRKRFFSVTEHIANCKGKFK